MGVERAERAKAFIDFPEPPNVRCPRCGCSVLMASVRDDAIFATCAGCGHVINVSGDEDLEGRKKERAVGKLLERSIAIASGAGIERKEFLEIMMALLVEEMAAEKGTRPMENRHVPFGTSS